MPEIKYVFNLYRRAVVNILSRLYAFYFSWFIPGSQEPGQRQSLATTVLNKFQTLFGISREIIYLLKPLKGKDQIYWKPIEKLTFSREIEEKVALVTDAYDGIGKETAIELAKLGFKVIIGVNDLVLMNEIIDKVKTKFEHVQITALKLDLSSLTSVRIFADQVTKQETKIHLLINSADEYSRQHQITTEGFEKNFVQNYLGHYLLTRLILQNLVNARYSRIVNVTSVAHHFGRINLDDINFNKFFISQMAYTQSKLAQVLFTKELANRLNGTNINVYAVNPGVIRKRLAYQNKIWILSGLVERLTNSKLGAQTVLHAALEESLENDSGEYYSNLKKVEYVKKTAKDEVILKHLWKLSSNLVKLDPDIKLNTTSIVLHRVETRIEDETLTTTSIETNKTK